MKSLMLKAAPLLAVALICRHAVAQVVLPVPAELEGPIDSMSAVVNGAVSFQVLGMTINVPRGVPISTPAGPLTAAQFADPTPLPGRSQGGFLGTVAIVTGVVNPATGITTANSVVVDPVHNAALGVITGNVGGRLTLNNAPITPLTDPRLRGSIKNAFGFDIIPSSIPVGAIAAVEGYFANGTVNAFLVEVEGAGQVTNPNPQISIQLAQSRERTPNNQRGDEIEVRGGVTTTHAAPGVTTQIIRIFRVDNGRERLLGTATATLDPLTPGFAAYTFRGTTALTNNVLLGTAPTVIRARNVSARARNATVTVQAVVR